jgi:CBS domain-containing protein
MTTLWSTPVREYMSRALIAVPPHTPLSEVQRLFDERDISAVPIVDEAGALRGIVSSTDLLRVARIELTSPGAAPLLTAPALRAADIMRTDVVAIDEAAPLRDAAAKMVERRIHRLVVLRKGLPVGVISTRDAMRAVLFHHIEVPLERVMTTPVETIDLGEPIDAAIARLADVNVRGLVVVDGEWPVGVFTHTEAIKARALPPELLRTPVEQVMSYQTICLNVATPLYRVAGHAIQTRVRRILAVEQRRLCGIVTGFDLVRFMTTEGA